MTAVSPGAIRAAVVTVSDTRTLETDAGGAAIDELSTEAGLVALGRHLIPDDTDVVRQLVQELVATGRARRPDVVLMTGGTGVSPRDNTVDAITPLFDRRLDGFGELFRMLSFAEIGPAAMLSRATAGIVGGVAVFVMPGSPAAIRLAMRRLILPELGHLIAELRRPASGAAVNEVQNRDLDTEAAQAQGQGHHRSHDHRPDEHHHQYHHQHERQSRHDDEDDDRRKP